MAAQGERTTSYVVPTYEAPPDPCWYHFLHGNVPGHQIDFIYRPEVPQGPLTPQHFSHLSRLVRYIEPRTRCAYAFAIGNLSRDDTQYEPGRGGVALIFGLRIRGAKDHAGRQDPPFCHAMAAVARQLDQARLLEASMAFYRKLLPDDESQAEGSGWYHTYVRHAENADALLPLLQAYVADFEDLPAPRPSGLGLRWTAGEAAPPRRVVIVHGDREPFEVIAACAARIAGVLVESDIRWTAISNGRDVDVPGGVSVRFVPQQEAGGEEQEAGVRVLRREEVPEDPKALAERLFGAKAARSSQRAGPRMGWREVCGKEAAGDGADGVRESAPPKVGTGSAGRAAGTRGVAKRSRRRAGALVGLGVALTMAGGMAAVLMGTKWAARNGDGLSGGAQSAAEETRGEKGAAATTTTEAVSAARPTVIPTAEHEVSTQKRVQGAAGEKKRYEKPAGTWKKSGGTKSVYAFDVPPELKK